LEMHGLGSNGNRRWVPATLGKALVRASDSLRAIGIEFHRDKSNNGRERRVHFRKVQPNAVRSVQPSDGAASDPDGSDSADGIAPTVAGRERAHLVIAAYARPESMLYGELLDFFEECASKSTEQQALTDLASEIHRRKRRGVDDS
jgi:hypothetical protein